MNRVGAVAAGLQALVLLVFGGYFVLGTLTGQSSDAVRGMSGGLLILVTGIGLGVLAAALWRADRRGRTPALVWGALLVPVAITMAQSEQPRLAVGVVATLVPLVLGALAMSSDPADVG